MTVKQQYAISTSRAEVVCEVIAIKDNTKAPTSESSNKARADKA